MLIFYLYQTHRFTYRLLAGSSENEAEVLSGNVRSALMRAQSVLTWVEERVILASWNRGHEVMQVPDELEFELRTHSRFFREVRGFVIFSADFLPVVTTSDAGAVCKLGEVLADAPVSEERLFLYRRHNL
jgi:hypothetical protein